MVVIEDRKADRELGLAPKLMRGRGREWKVRVIGFLPPTVARDKDLG